VFREFKSQQLHQIRGVRLAGEPHQVEVFCIELYPVSHTRSQLSPEDMIESGVDSFLVIKGIEKKHSFWGISRFLTPSQTADYEGHRNEEQN